MKRIISILVVLGSFLLVANVTAQEVRFTMNGWAIGAGGGERSGGNFTLQGANGQVVTALSQGGGFTVSGGFWSVTNSSASSLYLPFAMKQIPPPKVFAWQRLGAGGLTISSLAIQGEQLFAADRRDFVKDGGLYRRSLAACGSTLAVALVRMPNVAAPGYSISFQGARGVLATHKNDIFYSEDNGNNWKQTTTPVKDSRTVAAAGQNVFYAGSNTTGIYRSLDGGVTWEQRTPQPAEVSVLRLDAIDPNLLWIGTESAGVYVLALSLDRLSPRNSGLNNPDSQKVWDFAFDRAGKIYLASDGGVFTWDNNSSAWQPFGLQGAVQARSLAVVDDQLYAGAQFIEKQSTIAGVWRRPLSGGNWEQVISSGWNPNYTVRDLLYDPTYCQGLLAATEDGVWVYR